MAKESKYAVLICSVLSIIAACGIIAGLLKSNALIPILCLLPTAAYEAYRTEGKFTIIASWLMLVILIAETVILWMNIDINLSKYILQSGVELNNNLKALCNLNILIPGVMAISSIYLFKRTAGVYTKWLSVIILITSIIIIYILMPESFKILFDAVKNKQL